MSFSSTSNNDDSTSSSSDEDILENMDQDDLVLFQMMAAMASNNDDLFNPCEMEEGGGSICEPNCWCPRCFRYNASHTNIIQDFDKLYIGGIRQVGCSSGPYH
jgi:hypothetical protein